VLEFGTSGGAPWGSPSKATSRATLTLQDGPSAKPRLHAWGSLGLYSPQVLGLDLRERLAMRRAVDSRHRFSQEAWDIQQAGATSFSIAGSRFPPDTSLTTCAPAATASAATAA
jgi:hypothetical protein